MAITTGAKVGAGLDGWALTEKREGISDHGVAFKIRDMRLAEHEVVRVLVVLAVRVLPGEVRDEEEGVEDLAATFHMGIRLQSHQLYCQKDP